MAPNPAQLQWLDALRAGNLDDLRACLPGTDLVSRLPGESTPLPGGTLALAWVAHEVSSTPRLGQWLPFLKALVAAGAPLVPPTPIPPSSGDYPLAAAIVQRQDDLFDALLEMATPQDLACLATARVLRDGHPVSLFDLALSCGHAHAARVLWDLDPSAPAPASLAGNPSGSLVLAARAHGSPALAPIFARLLKQPWPQHDRDTALAEAVLPSPLPDGTSNLLRARREVVQALLRQGANPCAKAHRADLPLLVRMLAQSPGRASVFTPGVLTLLAKAGADLTTPLDIHVEDPGEVSVYNASTHAINPSHPRSVANATPLGLACVLANARAAGELIDAGADLHHRDSRSRTPLHLAFLDPPSFTEAADTAIRLLTAGAAMTTLDQGARTPLDTWLAAHTPDPDAGQAPSTLDLARRMLAQTLSCHPHRLPDIAQAIAAKQEEAQAVGPDALTQAWSQALAPFLAATALDESLPAAPARRAPPRV